MYVNNVNRAFIGLQDFKLKKSPPFGLSRILFRATFGWLRMVERPLNMTGERPVENENETDKSPVSFFIALERG